MTECALLVWLVVVLWYFGGSRPTALIAALSFCALASPSHAAQLLIYDRNTSTGNTAIDDLRYQRGYVVQVFDDAKTLTQPMPAPFVVVKISGISKAAAEKYIAAELDANSKMVRRRLYGLAWADLPNAVKNALATDRYYETTWTAIRTYVKNLRTGVSE